MSSSIPSIPRKPPLNLLHTTPSHSLLVIPPPPPTYPSLDLSTSLSYSLSATLSVCLCLSLSMPVQPCRLYRSLSLSLHPCFPSSVPLSLYLSSFFALEAFEVSFTLPESPTHPHTHTTHRTKFLEGGSSRNRILAVVQRPADARLRLSPRSAEPQKGMPFSVAEHHRRA